MSDPSISLEQRAELIKLSHTLGVSETQVAFLSALDSATLRALRVAVQASLFEKHRGLFRKLAAASKLLPVVLMAKIGELAFSPILIARIANEMEADRAVDTAVRMSTPYLADVCRHLDPACTGDILRKMPADHVCRVAMELLRRREYVVMGRFLDAISPQALQVTVASINDHAAMLQIGFFVESKYRLNDVIDLLDDMRIEDLVRTAHAQPDVLWREAMTLMAYIDAPRRRRFLDILATQPAEWLEDMLSITHRLGLWPALLPILADGSVNAQRTLFGLPAAGQEDVLAAVLLAALRLEAPDRFLPMCDALPSTHRVTLLNLLERFAPALPADVRSLASRLRQRLESPPPAVDH